MNKNRYKIVISMIVASLVAVTSCNKEPDESNLYTFTGQTIQDYLEAHDEEYHNFNVILKRSGYDRMLDTYGQYTCYAPTNEGVERYIDSLYNDETALIPHNGLTSNSLEGLTDSMCVSIAKYHISGIKYTYLETFSVASSTPITTILNTSFLATAGKDGLVRLNNVAAIDTYKHDLEMTNGYVQVIDNVIPLESKTVYDKLQTMDEFSIFFDALKLCQLGDILSIKQKSGTYTVSSLAGRPGGSWNGPYYYPTECKVKYTIFAEPDTVFQKMGINSVEDLKAKCDEWYAGADDPVSGWYEHPGTEKVSTGNDYANTYNTLNMFVRYHILAAGMPVSKLLYDKEGQGIEAGNENWNYSFGGEPYDYYETLLPHTLMKIWQPLYSHPNNGNNIYINQYHPLNTLTDEIGTFGKDFPYGIHDESKGGFPGVLIDRKNSDINTVNGYVHRICSPLIYTRDVNEKVLNERLRIDMSTILYEMINNDIRFAKGTEIGARNQNGNDGNMVLIPSNYCDNIKVYNTKTKMSFYVQGAWRAWESDQISIWDEYDFAFRLPPVPSGTYEIRIIYPATTFGGYMQYYIGTSSSTSTMQPLGIPIDASYPDVSNEAERNDVGYYLSTDITDYGVSSDLIMRNKGYMRAPASFSRGTWNGQQAPASSAQELVDNINYSCRYSNDGGTLFRKILGTVNIKQGEERWIRMKNQLTGYDALGASIDFIELVPINIVNSQDYSEDWY